MGLLSLSDSLCQREACGTCGKNLLLTRLDLPLGFLPLRTSMFLFLLRNVRKSDSNSNYQYPLFRQSHLSIFTSAAECQKKRIKLKLPVPLFSPESPQYFYFFCMVRKSDSNSNYQYLFFRQSHLSIFTSSAWSEKATQTQITSTSFSARAASVFLLLLQDVRKSDSNSNYQYLFFRQCHLSIFTSDEECQKKLRLRPKLPVPLFYA
jgi:hypothetical protein